MENEQDKALRPDRTVRRYLYEAVKKIDLVDFIEREAGATFSRAGHGAQCICPMPYHKDSSPSFSVSRESDGVWLFHCFGCDAKGTIIDFCIDYFSIDTPYEALLMIVKKSGLKVDSDLLLKAIKETKSEIDMERHMESSHFVAATRCHRLLTTFKENQEIHQWVAKAYHEMNKMLENGDVDGINRIGVEAFNKIVPGGC